MAEPSIPSVPRPSVPRPALRPQSYPFAKRRGNRKQSACQSQSRLADCRSWLAHRYVESITRLFVSTSSENLALPPPKASDRQSNTAPTTFGKRRRGVVERITTGGGQTAGCRLTSLSPAWNRPELFCGRRFVPSPRIWNLRKPPVPCRIAPRKGAAAESPAVAPTNSQNDYVLLTTRHGVQS